MFYRVELLVAKTRCSTNGLGAVFLANLAPRKKAEEGSQKGRNTVQVLCESPRHGHGSIVDTVGPFLNRVDRHLRGRRTHVRKLSKTVQEGPKKSHKELHEQPGRLTKHCWTTLGLVLDPFSAPCPRVQVSKKEHTRTICRAWFRAVEHPPQKVILTISGHARGVH